jgi:hypothetical protein
MYISLLLFHVFLESWVLTQSIIHKGFEMVLFKWVSKEEGEEYGGHFRTIFIFILNNSYLFKSWKNIKFT